MSDSKSETSNLKTLKRGAIGIAMTFVLAASLISGCGGAEESGETTSSASAPASDEAAPQSASEAKGASPAAPTLQLIQAASTVPRRIIYNATVNLISNDFSATQRDLLGLIGKHGGYLAETEIGAAPGTPRRGSWKIRVPEPQFRAFMDSVVKLGELQSTQTDSQDVTAEFTDLQARIGNKQVEEKRLVEHLKRSTAKLSDILQVEREISRVRGEIEQMQGRLRLLANLSSLTTITVTVQEIKGYVAPAPPTFGSQIARSFSASFAALTSFGQNLLLVLVALLPWAAILALVGFPLWRLSRHRFKRP